MPTGDSRYVDRFLQPGTGLALASSQMCKTPFSAGVSFPKDACRLRGCLPVNQHSPAAIEGATCFGATGRVVLDADWLLFLAMWVKFCLRTEMGT